MILGKFPFASFCPFTIASMMLGWSDPRFTKQCVIPASQIASKKAKEAVYMSPGFPERDDVVALAAVVAYLRNWEDTRDLGWTLVESALVRLESVLNVVTDAPVLTMLMTLFGHLGSVCGRRHFEMSLNPRE